MAEVMGFTGTVVTVTKVAIDIGKALIELRRMWLTIKVVSNDIHELTDQMEFLYPTLMEIETQTSSEAQSEIVLKRASLYCCRTLDHLINVMEQLNGATNSAEKKRKFSNLKLQSRKT
ncbi:hypothetical protein F5Y16DRAFT_404097 [Xylariaceae sp. FL0255]|nr:hypothetical protein F5Y16DRAFT_404097 [Xylariaceae sp. FL0255]